MTSRTNRDSEGQCQRGKTPTLPSALERRRQEALERYLAGDPIEVICREMGCAKSWLYKWKKRYQVTEADWFQAYSQRPETEYRKFKRHFHPAAATARLRWQRLSAAWTGGSGWVTVEPQGFL